MEIIYKNRRIMLLTACIVLYKNDVNVVTKAIESVLQFDGDLKLYLIDNSPENKLKVLKNDDRIIYIHNPSNPGFGAAHNIAIKKSFELGAQYHLVLNPDTQFNGGVLESLTEFMDDNLNIGNVMPKVYYPDGTVQYLCKLLPTPYDWVLRRFNPIRAMVEKRNHLFELRFTQYSDVMDVPYLSGCFMFLRVDALKKTGLFDEGIFMYGEETDLCRRLIDDGYRTVFFPKVSIIHHFEKGSHKSWRLTWIGIKSAIYYFNKWGWVLDRRRRKINKETLTRLNYDNE